MAEFSLMNEKVKTDLKGNVISSQSLSPVPTIQTVTPTPDNTNYAGITSGVTESVINDYKSLNTQQINARNAQTTGGSDILSLMNQLTGKAADTQAANEAAGVNKETENLNKYVSQLADLNAQASSLNREAQAIPIQIQQNAQGQGQTDRGIAPIEAGQQRLNTLKALSIGQQSDIAAAAATGSQLRLQAAKEKAQQIVDLKYKPLEEQVVLKQKQYDLNKDVLDFLDKRRSEALQIAINKEAKDLEEQKDKEKTIQDLAIKASAFGAPPDVVSAVTNSKSIVAAINAAGKFTSDPLDRILKLGQIDSNKVDIQYKKAQMAKIAQDIKESNAKLNPPTVPGSITDMATKMLNTAGSKADLSQGERQNLSKALTVIDQLDSLQSMIAKENYKGGVGPFKGRVNKIIAYLGQNPNAGAINAALKAVTPNLARGVYGEVGVLTDADINNYVKTLPNLTTAQQQNDLVLAMTLRTIQSSVKNQLTAAANSGVNVSGWVTDYNSLTQKITGIENRIGVSKMKVNDVIRSNPTLAPMIKELYQSGASDADVLQALGASGI